MRHRGDILPRWSSLFFLSYWFIKFLWILLKRSCFGVALWRVPHLIFHQTTEKTGENTMPYLVLGAHCSRWEEEDNLAPTQLHHVNQTQIMGWKFRWVFCGYLHFYLLRTNKNTTFLSLHRLTWKYRTPSWNSIAPVLVQPLLCVLAAIPGHLSLLKP